MSRDTTLSSLAMLKVHIDSGKDYLEYLRPFVIHSLSRCEENAPISDSKVSEEIKEFFGLEIPPRTTQILLQRLAKDGILQKKHGRFVVTGELPSTTSLLQEKTDAERKINATSKNLVSFAKEQYERELNDDDAFEAITLFLSKFSVSCLKSFLRGTALPNHLDAKDWKLVLVSKFIEHIEQTAPTHFENFILLVKGHMLANALLCPDLDFSSKSYNGVSFYLDTPILLKLLGLDGAINKQATIELISQLTSLGATVHFFSHTLEELVNTIKSSSDYIDSQEGRGSIVYEARKSSLRKSDLILIAENSRESLENLGISYKPTPSYSTKYQIDEQKFEEILNKEVLYNNPKARAVDVNSVRSIFAIRKGTQPNKIENCKGALITSNSGFASAAFEYGKKIENSPEVSSVITDFSISNIAWLKAPLGAPLLPQREVMAFAYATARPTDDFLHKVLAEADKLEAAGKINPRDHQLLRSSYHAQQALKDLTLGEEDSLNEKSILRALEIAENEIKQEETEKLLNEQDQHKSTLKELEKNKLRISSIQKNMYWEAHKDSKILVNFIYALCILAIALGTTRGLSPQLSKIIPDTYTYFVLLISSTSLIFGFSLKGIKQSIHSKYHNYLFKKRCRSLEIPIEENSVIIEEMT
ncbi:hypothetical protein ACNKU7_06125 [Microbulbifer sp. SA54]|uniref:hypothetical protein n=1 Tax=Microbulbifer sp. SA54 TaxID=3401577 RepID=UPI003AB03DDE